MRSTPAARSPARRGRRRAADGAALLLLTIAAPARAEIGFNLALASDDRFRGETTSDKRPVVTGTLSYDDAGGFYVGASATAGKLPGRDFRVLRLTQNAGYTSRIASDLSIELGVIHRSYSQAVDLEYARRFTEFYLGLAGRRGAARLFLAPRYGRDGGAAVYGEVEPSLYADDRWSLAGHLGVLLPPKENGEERHRPELDTRLSLARRLGRLALSASLIGKGPGEDSGRWHAAAMVAVSRAF